MIGIDLMNIAVLGVAGASLGVDRPAQAPDATVLVCQLQSVGPARVASGRRPRTWQVTLREEDPAALTGMIVEDPMLGGSHRMDVDRQSSFFAGQVREGKDRPATASYRVTIVPTRGLLMQARYALGSSGSSPRRGQGLCTEGSSR